MDIYEGGTIYTHTKNGIKMERQRTILGWRFWPP